MRSKSKKPARALDCPCGVGSKTAFFTKFSFQNLLFLLLTNGAKYAIIYTWANSARPEGQNKLKEVYIMKEFEEVRTPYLSAACKPSTSIAAHVIVYCDCGSQVDIVRYYGSGRCRIFISGTIANPDDEMTIYTSLRRLPVSVAGLLDLAAHSDFPCISCTYDFSALHMVHYGTAHFDHITSGVLFRG